MSHKTKSTGVHDPPGAQVRPGMTFSTPDFLLEKTFPTLPGLSSGIALPALANPQDELLRLHHAEGLSYLGNGVLPASRNGLDSGSIKQ